MGPQNGCASGSYEDQTREEARSSEIHGPSPCEGASEGEMTERLRTRL